MRQNRDIKAWLSPNDKKRAILIKSASQKSAPLAPIPQDRQVLSPLILELLKPIETEGGIPYELTDAYRRKKKKKKGPGL